MTYKLKTGCSNIATIFALEPFRLVLPIDKACQTKRIATARTLASVELCCMQCQFGSADVVVVDGDGAVVDLSVADAVPNTSTAEAAEVVGPSTRRRQLPAGLITTGSLPIDLRQKAVVEAVDLARISDQLEIDIEEGTDLDGVPAHVIDLAKYPTVEGLVTTTNPDWVSGASPFGTTKIRAFRTCLRQGYWRYVRGLVPAAWGRFQPSAYDARTLGWLVHLTLQLFYTTGHTETWGGVQAVHPYYPALANECRRLVMQYLNYFNVLEQNRWDVRGIEVDSRYYYPARKCAGKRRRLGVTCRSDGCVRKKKPHEPCLPAGERAAHGLFIHEIKTTIRVTGSFAAKFRVDPQVRLNLLCFNEGNAIDEDGSLLDVSSADLYGRAEGVEVSVIGKAKHHDPEKHIKRFPVILNDQQIADFREPLGDWLYNEFGDRFFSEYKDDPDTWPRSWMCTDYTDYVCPFADICERSSTPERVGGYVVDEKNVLRGELLELDEKPKKLKRVKRSVVTEAVGK